MSNKIMSSGELLSNLNKNIDKSHHKKPDSKIIQPQQTQKLKENQITEQQERQVDLQKSIKRQQQQQALQIKKVSPTQKYQKSQASEQPSNKSQKEQKGQTQKQQNKTAKSNLSKATQIWNKKSNFHSKFQNEGHYIQEEQIGQTLHDILAMQIGNLISKPLAEVIQASMKQKEDQIYVAFTQTEKSYLQSLLEREKKKQNNSISEIESLLALRQVKTMQKLDNGELYIDKQRAITSKSQIQDLHKMDVARLLKIKDGAIRSKLDLLHDKMFEFQAIEVTPQNSTESLKKYQQQKLQEITDPSNFSLNSQKTKIAHDYVKHLQHQKLMLLKKLRQRQQKRALQQKQRESEMQEADEMRNAAKKQELQQKVKQYRKKREQQVSQVQQKSKKVEEFLKQYRKSLPLYKKKEKEFTQVHQKKKVKQIQQKLKSIRQNRRSLSLNQIKQHEHKYLQRKYMDQSKKQQDFKMMEKSRKASESAKQYFKGFYHDKVKIIDQQERLKFYSMREATKQKIERMTEFDEKIRKLHKPKVDQKKKEALQRIIEFDELKKKRVKKAFKQVTDQNGQIKLQAYYEEIPEVDHYREGNKYMQIAKSLAKKKKPEQVSRYSQEPQIDLEELERSQQQKSRMKKSQIADWQTPSPIVSQEKDIWRLRSKQLNQMTNQINPQNFQQIKKNLQVMDDKAKMREELLKHKDSDAHEMMHQKSMLDEFYLESIKNKIKLLNE